jgi:pyruvate/2-oxoglutarate/acetoin dehydrogenase E1 component
LEWAKEYDCIHQFKLWILNYGAENGKTIATEEELEAIENEAKKYVRDEKNKAWKAFLDPIKQEISELNTLLKNLASASANKAFIEKLQADFASKIEPLRREILETARKALRIVRNENLPAKTALSQWIQQQIELNYERYSSYLHDETEYSALNVSPIAPTYDPNPEMVDGRIVLNKTFDHLFATNPLFLTFGEDTGKIGGVNQSMEGMQEKYGELRVSDTGIREATILGQGIGLAMRGLRPIAEIQYLDYLLYCLQLMSDDLATVQYRTKGGQRSPLIIRTRGHRLEGVWHSGSPMAGILNLVRGVHVCVPRNMTKAAGFYNTLMAAQEPALVVECLNGYRSKEPLPNNIGEFRTSLGVVEVVQEGTDVTIVSYGSTFNLCVQAAKQLAEAGISAELIDVQTLLPFDLGHDIVKSLQKTNKIIFIDEDVPGGATAFMMQKVMEEQNGYKYLDSQPRTLTAKAHRPPYGSDGDYFSKPSTDDIFEVVYEMMHEYRPKDFPKLY